MTLAAEPAADTVVRPEGRIRARLRRYGSAENTRIIGVDVARGLAVLGMYGAHVGVTQGFEWGSPATWTDVVNGRSSILFALLAGLSIAIISGRQQPLTGVPLLQARIRIFTRAALIFTIGGLLEFLGTGVAVILPTYAALFVLSLPFLRWPPRRLFIAAGIVAAVAPLLLAFHPEYLVSPEGYYGGESEIVDLLFYGVYPGIVWIAFVLTGLAIGRLDLGALRVQVRLVVIGLVLAVVGYGIGAIGDALFAPAEESSSSSASSSSWAPEVVAGEELDLSGTECEDYGDSTYYCYPKGDAGVPLDEGQTDAPAIFDLPALFTAAPHSGSTLEVLGSTGFAMLVLGLTLLATRRRVLRWILYPVASVGAMALTAYSVHIIAIAASGDLVYGITSNAVWIVFSVVALVLCTLWVTLVGKGPLEHLLTRVSHKAAEVAHHD
jgi:uncharacterized membrane protein YeiB